MLIPPSINEPNVFLASQSPRRAELLRQIGVEFTHLAISVPEKQSTSETCHEYVSRLARQKAMAGLAKCMSDKSAVVIGADTVLLFKGQVLEKPRDEVDARHILLRLSNKTHEVQTAVTVCSHRHCETMVQVSRVKMRQISQLEIAAYWRTGEPIDKAGGYAIQGKAAVFIEHIEGSYSGIMGLPIYETARLLNIFGVKG